MGAALILPIVVFLMLGAIWFAFTARKTSQARRLEDSLPDDPYQQREEELNRLRQDHVDSDPARTAHPARRP